MNKKVFTGLATVLLMLGLTGGNVFATRISPNGVGSVGTLTDLGYFSAGSYINPEKYSGIGFFCRETAR